MRNTLSVLSDLKSPKVKTREEALKSIREIFAKDTVVANWHLENGREEPKNWLSIFQAVFGAVSIEYDDYLKAIRDKKAGDAPSRRLGYAAATVRWLTERTIPYISRNVMQSVLNHCTQMLAGRKLNSMTTPYALDYAKTLKALLSYPAHLDHLNHGTWVTIVELSFNVLLGDKPSDSFAYEGDEEEEEEEDMDVDSGAGEDDDEHKTAGRKRHRGASAAPILSPRKRLAARRNTRVSIAVTQEQVEFASLLPLLMASDKSPLLSRTYPFLAKGVMKRLQRFLERYPAESTLLHDYLTLLSTTLGHLALNHKDLVQRFAKETWESLVALWSTKDKRIKEDLIVILKLLYHYLVSDTSDSVQDCVDGLTQLWSIFDTESEKRWGIDALSLDALRLEVVQPGNGYGQEPLVAKTFRAGLDFDANQSVSWAVLELQADCAGKLCELSESMRSVGSPGPARMEKKRKLENPIRALICMIETKTTPSARVHNLQVLLFFVERHWKLVSNSLKEDVLNLLLQYVSSDDAVVQSWTLLNLAAIAHAEGSSALSNQSKSSLLLDTSVWDPVWTHAIRRTNSAAVCRAACHAAYTLLVSLYPNTPSHTNFLSPARVLQEIETLGKDMDVQGPSYPFDSVCMFLSQCLMIASQDARLYRMKLEDKVLSWLVDTWKVTSLSMVRATNVASQTVDDTLLLLQTICALSQRVNHDIPPYITSSIIVSSLKEEARVKVIRDYVLLAKLPPYTPRQMHSSRIRSTQRLKTDPSISTSSFSQHRHTVDSDQPLAPPSVRERRLSAFFCKSLDTLAVEWDTLKSSHPRAEVARASLDFTISALLFEVSLAFNGIVPNRQVFVHASKVVHSIVPLLLDRLWTVAEKTLVILALEVLTDAREPRDEGHFDEDAGLVAPGLASGIRYEVLRGIADKLDKGKGREIGDIETQRVSFLRLFWQQAEIQPMLKKVTKTLREMIRRAVDPSAQDKADSNRMDVDDFGPIRISAAQSAQGPGAPSGDVEASSRLFGVAVSFLTSGPFLQSSSREPSRDSELVDLVVRACEESVPMFSAVCPALLQEARKGTLALHPRQLCTLLESIGAVLEQYVTSKSHTLRLLLLEVLHSTIDVWESQAARQSEVRTVVKTFLSFFAGFATNQLQSSWGLRKNLAEFMTHYLEVDPTAELWRPADQDGNVLEDRLPLYLLRQMNFDDDMRVRFPAAVLSGHVMALSSKLGLDPPTAYQDFRNEEAELDYPLDVDNGQERLLSRILHIGNLAIANSAVRRGTYWHLLELCQPYPQFSAHTRAVLEGVSQRLGLPSLAALFDAFASQIAYSIIKAGMDFFQIPPYLLGYRERRKCAEAAFRPFTPQNLIADAHTFFESHCRVLGKSLEDGLVECFADIVGFLIVDTFGNDRPVELLVKSIHGTFAGLPDVSKMLQNRLPDIIAFILRTLGDQDLEGPDGIFPQLKAWYSNLPKPAHGKDDYNQRLDHFLKLTAYRGSERFEAHPPHLPQFGTETILRSLAWATQNIPVASNSATSFHVVHYFMNELRSTPFVNEQMRLINGLTVWVADHHRDFATPTNMQCLLHGASLLLGQADLARAAQSIIDWALTRIKTQSFSVTKRFPDVLVRIRCTAHEYELQKDNAYLSELGRDLGAWIDEKLVYLVAKLNGGEKDGVLDADVDGMDKKIAVLKSPEKPRSSGDKDRYHKTLIEAVCQALTTWPCEPPEGIQFYYQNIIALDLSNTLNEARMKTNKFRLVRRLQEHSQHGSIYDAETYATKDFWRLKESIPPSDRLEEEDAKAFVWLLELNDGHFDSFKFEHINSATPRTFHVQCWGSDPTSGRDKERAATKQPDQHLSAARNGVVFALCHMLDDEDGAIVDTAYRSLRLVLAAQPQKYSMRDYSLEFDYLKAYPQPTLSRQAVKLDELLASDAFLSSFSQFHEWIKLITIAFSDVLAATDPFFAQLTPILTTNVEFAEMILPVLVHAILQHERRSLSGTSSQISGPLRRAISAHFLTLLSSPITCIPCRKATIDVVLHLRYFTPWVDASNDQGTDPLALNKWLDMDWALLAKNSVACGAYTTALLCLELAADEDATTVGGKDAESQVALSTKANPSDSGILSFSQSQSTARRLRDNPSERENVLYEIYAHIDEPDGFYGIQSTDLNHFLMKRFHHEKQWDEAFRFHGAHFEAGRDVAPIGALTAIPGGSQSSPMYGGTQGLLESFHFFGFNQLANDTLQSIPSSGPDGSSTTTNSLSYRLGWRTENWDLPSQSHSGIQSVGAPLYHALRAAFCERDPRMLEETVRSSLYCEMDRLRVLGSESFAELRETVGDLVCLSEVVDWIGLVDRAARGGHAGKIEVSDLERLVDVSDGLSFSDLEAIMATRISLIRSIRQREEKQQLGNMKSTYLSQLLAIEKKCLLRLSRAARDAGHVQVALNSVVRAQTLLTHEQGGSIVAMETGKNAVQEELANVLWLQREERVAVKFLQELVGNDVAPAGPGANKRLLAKQRAETCTKAVRLARLGTWIAEACLEKPMKILEDYFGPASLQLEGEKDPKAYASVFRNYAMFAEQQYQEILKSPDGRRIDLYMKRKTSELEQLQKEIRNASSSSERDQLSREAHKAKKLLAGDTEVFDERRMTREALLHAALDMHARCLQVTDVYDVDSAIRFCSLWFGVFEEANFVPAVAKGLERIPSYKLVFLAHQLTARLTSSGGTELPMHQVNLQKVVLRMCKEHPFHSLYQVFALKPPTVAISASEASSSSSIRRQSGRIAASPLSQSQSPTQIERGTAAKGIFEKLLSADRVTEKRVLDIEKACKAYLSWAKFAIKGHPVFDPAQRRSGKEKVIPEDQLIMKLKQVPVPVVTARTPLDPTLEYKNVVEIVSYEKRFELAGGVNLPKICVCLGSDGNKYKQLFKGEGNDDLRQDAVMEQVFDLVNGLLNRDRETRRRELRVKDYKVVPLGDQAGVIEFVINTQPFRDWLRSAHIRYRPKDTHPDEVSKLLRKNAEQCRGAPQKQTEGFLKIKEKFRPVMRHYFTERHKTPIAWFGMRLRYTRSVATTSIVGHVLGLGDRHVSNILLDRVTGEVVHIDLGIAFDQGKLLTVPERVPFRMTEDVVDGMGTSGTAGVFQRCAEETLRVLRDESGVIMTVLEVFRHDPLHSWTASEVKRQQADSEMTNADEAADRALSSVARKLNKSLSVEATVSGLISEATDATNLALIYHGWSPHY